MALRGKPNVSPGSEITTRERGATKEFAAPTMDPAEKARVGGPPRDMMNESGQAERKAPAKGRFTQS